MSDLDLSCALHVAHTAMRTAGGSTSAADARSGSSQCPG
jgi:hypothetical protein